MGTKMFKLGSFEEEIMLGMQKKLVSSQLENNFSLEKLSKAAEFINTAAEILDDTGFTVEADMLTEVLKRLADEQDADVYPSTPHDTTEEVLTASHFPGETTPPDQVIMEPLEQEIEVAPRVAAEDKRFQDIALYISAMGKKKSLKSKKDFHTKNLTPEKQLKNLKEHGTVFNMADDNFVADLLEADLGVGLNVNEEPGPTSDKTFEDEE